MQPEHSGKIVCPTLMHQNILSYQSHVAPPRDSIFAGNVSNLHRNGAYGLDNNYSKMLNTHMPESLRSRMLVEAGERGARICSCEMSRLTAVVAHWLLQPAHENSIGWGESPRNAEIGDSCSTDTFAVSHY